MTAAPAPARPRVAVVATCAFRLSHTDVILSRLLQGYRWPVGSGEVHPSRIEVVALYLDQLTGDWEAGRGPDVGRVLAGRHGVRMATTIAEALVDADDRPIDGVIIIGEHGDYPYNEFGQKLYPRRRLFDTVVAALQARGRAVPIFIDKHLATDTVDARWMHDTARRLGLPLLAGSSLPLAWRTPTGTRWPTGMMACEAVVVHYGDVESYGFHALEGIQELLENRGRSAVTAGVAAVSAVADRGGLDQVPAALLMKALGAAGYPESDDDTLETWKRGVTDVLRIEFLDGLVVHLVRIGPGLSPPFETFATAVRGDDGVEMTLRWELPGDPFDHFTLLVRQVESLVLTGREPFPSERTLLTTGILAALMRARAGGTRMATPELDFGYRPSVLTGTAVDDPLPPADPPAESYFE